MVLGTPLKLKSSESSNHNSDLISRLARHTLRVVHAVNFVSASGYSENHQRRRVRLSKSGAVLVGFFIFHSLPNALLLTKEGRAKYSAYGKYHSSSTVTKLIELFLLSAGLTHGIFAVLKGWDRFKSKNSDHPHSRLREMTITGSLIFILMAMHLFDFRLNPNEDERHLDAQVLELLDKRYRRMKNSLYWLLISSVFVHAWRGSTKAWLYRLGFREEIPVLHGLCKTLLAISGILYTIPLVMDNPYSQDPGSPVRGPRIITVD